MSRFTKVNYQFVADSINQSKTVIARELVDAPASVMATAMGTIDVVVENLASRFKVDNSRFKDVEFRDRALR
jgi:hypothetical protein